MNPFHGSVPDLIGNIILFSNFIPLALFVYFYKTRSPWRSTHLGISLMVQKVDLFLILFLGAISVFMGVFFPGREWLRMAIYLVLSATFWFDLYTLRQVQRSHHKASPRDRKRLDKLKH